jgi:hypothetical protein
MTEDRRAAHAVQRLENDVAMLRGELAQDIRAAADQRGRGALRKLRREQLLVAVTQALRLVDYQHPGALGLLEQVRGVNEFHVERWILAHQDHVQIIQAAVDFGFQLEPVGRVCEHFQRLHARACLAGVLIQVVLFHIKQATSRGPALQGAWPASCPFYRRCAQWGP